MVQLDAAQGRQPVASRHPNVHQDDVRFMCRYQANGLLATLRFGHHLDVRTGNETPQATPDHLVVIDDKNLMLIRDSYVFFPRRRAEDRNQYGPTAPAGNVLKKQQTC